MSLFPDYPPIEHAHRPQPPCCSDWATFTERNPDAPAVYAVIHAFAHGRIPFTIDALAERANTTPEWASSAVDLALERDWVVRVYPEPYMHHPVLRAWVGCLARRR